MCGIVPLSTEFLMLQRCQDTVTFTQNIITFHYIWVGGVPQRAVLPHSPLHGKNRPLEKILGAPLKHNMVIKHFEKLQICVCVCQK